MSTTETTPNFMQMSANELVGILTNHKNRPTTHVEGATAEIARRIAKGVKQPITEQWYLAVQDAFVNAKPIPRKATIKARMEKAGTPLTRKAEQRAKAQQETPAKTGQSTETQYATLKDLSPAQWDAILGAESLESLATTYRPVS